MQIQRADYLDPAHRQAIIELLDGYAKDPMGGGQPLPPKVKEQLVSELNKIAGAFSILAWQNDQAIGLVNCFQGFSTFKCKPLINIHDIVVASGWRGQGVSQKMLAEVEHIARQRGCCKLTLEVLEGNQPAQRAYQRFGFVAYELDPAMGRALFWEKQL